MARISLRESHMRLAIGLLILTLTGCGGAVAAHPGPQRDAAARDAGADAAVCPDGRLPLKACSNGRVQSSCCPANALCAMPVAYCDLGGGACVVGPCPADAGNDARGDASPACTVNSDCHKSNPDECNICKDMSLVCHLGACVCACQIGD